MSRTFVRANSEYLEVESAPVTAVPLTMACWFNSQDTANFQLLMWLGDKDSTNDFWRIALAGSVAGDPLYITAVDSGGSSAITTTGYSINTWHHACGVFTSNTSRAGFIDGGSKGTDSDNRSPDNADRLSIGRSADSTPASYASASIAEAAIWDAALTDAEVASLAEGYAPSMIRPGSLVFYAPLLRDEDRDVVGGLSLTPFNTPAIGDHPRIFYPPAPTVVPALTAASVIRWNDRGGIVLQTNANWGGAHYFEATLRATQGTVYARLVKASDGSAVANSQISTSSSTRTRVRSAALTLTDGVEYVAQTGWVPGADAGFANHPTILTI